MALDDGRNVRAKATPALKSPENVIVVLHNLETDRSREFLCLISRQSVPSGDKTHYVIDEPEMFEQQPFVSHWGAAEIISGFA
jgi:hypothetical protein